MSYDLYDAFQVLLINNDIYRVARLSFKQSVTSKLNFSHKKGIQVRFEAVCCCGNEPVK